MTEIQSSSGLVRDRNSMKSDESGESEITEFEEEEEEEDDDDREEEVIVELVSVLICEEDVSGRKDGTDEVAIFLSSVGLTRDLFEVAVDVVAGAGMVMLTTDDLCAR